MLASAQPENSVIKEIYGELVARRKLNQLEWSERASMRFSGRLRQKPALFPPEPFGRRKRVKIQPRSAILPGG
jgi:hypothetical protein